MTTTAPAAASAPPSCRGIRGDPRTHAPPWNHTTTGSPDPSGSGVNTFSVSGPRPSAGCHGDGAPGAGGPCGTAGPKAVASRTPSQPVTGTGAANRRGPTGASA